MRKPSFNFKDGVLTIDGALATYRLRWSPEPLAEELFVAPDRWKACWPDFRILKPQPNGKPKRSTVNAIDRWLEQYNHYV